MKNINKIFTVSPVLSLIVVVLLARPTAVEFLGLDASLEDHSVVLAWSTATETENLGFILEKKTDSLSAWNPLASYINSDALRGQGTVSTQTDYTYADSLVTDGETYFYRISGIDNANNIGRLDSLSIIFTEVGLKPVVPNQFSLQAYPNPFNPSITIDYVLPEPVHLEINIYDVRGLLVRQLITTYLDAGQHKLVWNAGGLSSGIYIVRIQTDKYFRSQKIVLIK